MQCQLHPCLFRRWLHHPAGSIPRRALSYAAVSPNRGEGLLLQLLVNTGDERPIPHWG
jgi:hypothetical protein